MRTISPMTIGRKIIALAGVLLALNVGLGLVAVKYLNQISAGTQQLAGRVAPSIYLAARIKTGAKAIILRVYRHVSSNSPKQMDSFESYATDREKSLRKELQSYADLASSSKDRELVDRISKDLDRMMEVWR